MREDHLEVEILSLCTEEVHIQGQSSASVIGADWPLCTRRTCTTSPSPHPPFLFSWFCCCSLAGVPSFLLLSSGVCVIDSQISVLWSRSVWNMLMTSTVLHSRSTLLLVESLPLGKMWTKVSL